MIDKRLIYISTLLGSLVFYWAYREWMSWFLLVFVLVLPWFSLVLSLPAMLTVRMEVRVPEQITRGEEAAVTYAGVCKLPIPAVKGKLRVTGSLTKTNLHLRNEDALPTSHCDHYTVTPERTWVYDYLGLFRLPVTKKTAVSFQVMPVPMVDTPPDLSRYLVDAWKPKPGGGFAENHELRLYRPGDSLRQIHWKLSAKTSKLIVREPMQPLEGMALLSLELSGTPDQLDQKLGKLLYVSRFLLKSEVFHCIQCLTGEGLQTYRVENENQLLQAIRTILCSAAVTHGEAPVASKAAWHHHIGGDSDEG